MINVINDKIPSGIADFDIIIGGGFPKGSSILLLGEHGSGYREFAITSAARLLLSAKNPRMKRFILGHDIDQKVLPSMIAYISFTSPREVVLEEINLSFNDEYYRILNSNMLFADLSNIYFRQTIVPSKWSNENLLEALADNNDNKKPLEVLVSFLEKYGKQNLVIIDSLSDLLYSKSVDMDDLLILLKGIRRISKAWKGIIYFTMTDRIVNEEKINIIKDCFDGVIKFEWLKNYKTSKRQRTMYIEKFMPLLVHANEMRISRFAIDITSINGLVVSNYERV